MKFLSRLGQLLAQGTAIWLGFAPLVKGSVPGQSGTIDVISADLTQIGNIIVTVEAMGQALGLKGPDKLKASIPLIAQVYLQSALLANQKIHDQALFMAGVEKVASGSADILNSLNDKIESKDKT